MVDVIFQYKLNQVFDRIYNLENLSGLETVKDEERVAIFDSRKIHTWGVRYKEFHAYGFYPW